MVRYLNPAVWEGNGARPVWIEKEITSLAARNTDGKKQNGGGGLAGWS